MHETSIEQKSSYSHTGPQLHHNKRSIAVQAVSFFVNGSASHASRDSIQISQKQPAMMMRRFASIFSTLESCKLLLSVAVVSCDIMRQDPANAEQRAPCTL